MELHNAYHGKMVRRCMRRYCLNPEDAQEVWNDVLLRIHDKSLDYKPGQDPVAWIYAMVRNRAIDTIRRRSALKRGGPGLRASANDEPDDDAPEPDERQLALLEPDAIAVALEMDAAAAVAQAGASDESDEDDAAPGLAYLPGRRLTPDELPASEPWRLALADCLSGRIEDFSKVNALLADTLALVYEEGLTMKAAAEFMGHAYDRTRQQFHRARPELAKRFDECLEIHANRG